MFPGWRESGQERVGTERTSLSFGDPYSVTTDTAQTILPSVQISILIFDLDRKTTMSKRKSAEAANGASVEACTASRPTPSTAAAHSVATEQLDSDEEDASKRSKLLPSLRTADINNNDDRKRLFSERKQLYQIQERKRRRQKSVAFHGRRSKELHKKEDCTTPRQQKVERLRMERKLIREEYANTGGSMKKRKQRKKKHNIPLPKK